LSKPSENETSINRPKNRIYLALGQLMLEKIALEAASVLVYP
jgi:hypothetical protein